MPYAFPIGVEKLLEANFKILGIPGVYRNAAGAHTITVLVKELERWAEIGRGGILNTRITFEVRTADVPRVLVGDTFTVGDRDYKVYQEPLRDPTGTLWIVEGAVI